jgi:VIT1/CCC1 family predicted Fe2+/Mn2+ transporter
LPQYLRDIILGVNDGLVSMFLIVFGMFGGGALARSILLAGITGAIAGAISMGLGEYIATKSQLEIMVSDVSRERFDLALY